MRIRYWISDVCSSDLQFRGTSPLLLSAGRQRRRVAGPFSHRTGDRAFSRALRPLLFADSASLSLFGLPEMARRAAGNDLVDGHHGAAAQGAGDAGELFAYLWGAGGRHNRAPVLFHRRTGAGDRKRVVEGKSVSVRLDLGCCRIIKKKKN